MLQSVCRGFADQLAVNRRELLRVGSLSCLGLSLPQLLQGQALAREQPTALPSASFGRAKACIMLFMWGGPAQQDTWDMKPKAPPEIRGQFNPIATNTPGIEICEYFPLMARQTQHLCLVRSMTHSDADHTTATNHLLTGQPVVRGADLFNGWPSIGSVLSKLGRGAGPLPRHIQMRPKVPGDCPRFVEQTHGQFAGWLGRDFDPLTIDDNPNTAEYHVGDFDLLPEISVRRLQERHGLLNDLRVGQQRLGDHSRFETLNGHYRRAFELLDSSVGKSAFDLSQESAATRDRYGRHAHGQSVLQARRFLERGVPLITVFWPSEGIKNVSVYWDTHSRNFVDLKERLIPPADQAFSALLEDLQQLGLMDETLVVWTGEFGRTPKVGQRNNVGAGQDGRDHWPSCFTSVLAGAGVRGGTVYGASDQHAAYPAANAVNPVDLVATIYHLLGVPQELTLQDAQNRPMVVCPGDPIMDLVS
jgi:hypothetical protein